MKAPSVKLPLLHRGKAGEPPGIVAVARVDQRTKNITKRLSPGDIAIIDHSDLDRVSAEELIRRKVAAVVNASVSITGRYPNLGPKLLLDAMTEVRALTSDKCVPCDVRNSKLMFAVSVVCLVATGCACANWSR